MFYTYYTQWWKGIVYNQNVELIDISDNLFISLSNAKELPSEGYKLFEINSDFIICEKLLKNSVYYNLIYSKVKNQGCYF
jgi:hypothetical protein